ncbi:MAG: HPP family protein [Saprospiraceae bacterium]|jgi:CBS domain-containing protein|nr:CBS domain-containing protein [Chitinophagia bacterium]
MDLLAPVSSMMTTEVKTVEPEDTMKKVEQVFRENRIHHIPVVEEGKLLGIVSKSDYLFFKRGFNDQTTDNRIDEFRLKTRKVKDIMTKGIAKLETADRIGVALEIFKENLFHAIPIVDDGKLVGIITTFDIIKKLSEE